MSNNCYGNCYGKCSGEETTSDVSEDDRNNLDCGSDSDMDWNVIVHQIKNCKIDECGKKHCKKERIIENRSHENVCYWTQSIPVYLRYYGELNDGSGFISYPLNQPLKFIASGNTLIVQATTPCVMDSLNFNNGVIIIPPCDQTPQRRPGRCNQVVNFDEVAYFVNVSSYDSFELNVGTTIKAVNGVLVFEDHEIHCLCDLIEYQQILQQNELKLSQSKTIVTAASGQPSTRKRSTSDSSNTQAQPNP